MTVGSQNARVSSRCAAGALLAVISMAAGAGARAADPGVDEVIRRSAEANARDWQAAPKYSYNERDRTDQGVTEYRVRMMAGSPYQELMAVNGKPLAAAARAEEQRKLKEALAQRESETPAQREKRVTDYENDRRRDHMLIQQLVRAFTFKLMGQQKLAGRQVYVVQATPRPDYAPPDRDSKVLTGMRGRLWIDTKTFQWVRVEARVIQPVWIEGFLARVDPGTRFLLEYRPVEGDIWQPSHFVMNAHAKVLFLFSRHDQADESYFNYARQPGNPA